MYDIIVVGAGCAGLTAALYARRAEKSVLVVEKNTFGGQITFSPKVENYPGIKQMSGNEFADMLVEQVLDQGAEIELGEVVGVRRKENGFAVSTAEGDEYTSKTVIIAAGAKHRMLGVEGEAELVGHGISFCAVCDGAFYKGLEVVVVGGGNSALQEALLLADNCKKVTLVQNLDVFTGEKKLLDALNAKNNVEYITGATVSDFETRDNEVCGVKLLNKDGKETSLAADGVFIAIGLAPDNGNFADVAEVDTNGYFSSDEGCTTVTPGVFVAGDCRAKGVRQLTTAAADGSAAALAACRYIDGM